MAFARKSGWLYVADSSNDRLVVLNIARIAPSLLAARKPPARVTGSGKVAG